MRRSPRPPCRPRRACRRWTRDGHLITCCPCAKGAFCACGAGGARHRRPWAPAERAFLPPPHHHLPTSCTQAAAKGVVECSFSNRSSIRALAGPPGAAAAAVAPAAAAAAAAAGTAAGRPSPRVESSQDVLSTRTSGADDAAGAVPSPLRPRQTTPPPDAPYEPELEVTVVPSVDRCR